MAHTIQPLGDRVLVEPSAESETEQGGIIIPDTAQDTQQWAKVVALGTGKKDDNGNQIPFEVKEGDTVLTSKYGGTEISYEGKDYKILKADDILAVFK